jgi:hypothetical protein
MGERTVSRPRNRLKPLTGTCPVSRGLQAGVKGRNINETTLPESPALQGGELYYTSGFSFTGTLFSKIIFPAPLRMTTYLLQAGSFEGSG